MNPQIVGAQAISAEVQPIAERTMKGQLCRK